MKIPCFGRYAALSCVAAVVLGGCGGSQVTIGAPGALKQSRQALDVSDASRSWILPEAGSEDLIYIADLASDSVDVYSYSDRTKVGRLREHVPSGVCADNAGDVWVVKNGNQLVEYAHGGTKPIAKLHGPYNSDLRSCVVDPTTGDLAVTAIEGPVYVFPHSTEPPRKYSDCGLNCASMDYCAYDNLGNLFVAGTVGVDSSDFHAAVWEVKRHHRPLIRLQFHHNVDFPFSGGIFWDGSKMAWEAERNADIYQFVKARRGSAEIVGDIELNIRSWIGQGAIHGQTVIIPYYFWKGPRGVAFLNYPAGGKRIAHIGDLKQPVAAAFSPARQNAKRTTRLSERVSRG